MISYKLWDVIHTENVVKTYPLLYLLHNLQLSVIVEIKFDFWLCYFFLGLFVFFQ